MILVMFNNHYFSKTIFSNKKSNEINVCNIKNYLRCKSKFIYYKSKILTLNF